MSEWSYILLEFTLTGLQKHLINTTKKSLKQVKSKIYSFETKKFSPKNFFSRAQYEIWDTSQPNASPSDAIPKQTILISHLQVSK